MTPQEIRAAALQVAVSCKALDTNEILRIAAKFEAYIEGPPVLAIEATPLPPLPQRRVVPVQRADAPAEHIDHDGELWGALCVGCAHSQGVHKFGGCHFVLQDMDYCPCQGFTLVRPADVPTETCTCESDHNHRYDRMNTGNHRCQYFGCPCKWAGGRDAA